MSEVLDLFSLNPTVPPQKSEPVHTMLAPLTALALAGAVSALHHPPAHGGDWTAPPTADVTDPNPPSHPPHHPTEPADHFQEHNYDHDDGRAPEVPHEVHHPGWRNHGVPEPVHYIDATCEDLCADQCVGAGLLSEVGISALERGGRDSSHCRR